jgi:hypothetical protein
MHNTTDGELIPVWRFNEVIGYARISPEDAPLVRAHRWGVKRFVRNGRERMYVKRQVGKGGVDQITVWLHREILGLPRKWKHGDPEGDHINGDSFDNRRENLRAVSHRTNVQNIAVRGVSGHRGVYWVSDRRAGAQWVAKVKIDDKTLYLGAFGSKEEAVSVVTEWYGKNMPGAVAARLVAA